MRHVYLWLERACALAMAMCIALCGARPGLSAASGERAELRYDMELELDADMTRISGRVLIEFANCSADAWSEVYLRDFADSVLAEDDVRNGVGVLYADEEDMYPSPTAAPWGQHINGDSEITSARQDGVELELEPRADDPSVICVRLNQPLEPGQRAALELDYYADIPEGGYRLGRGSLDRFGEQPEPGARTLELAQFYPMMAVYEEGEWICDPYIIDGECMYTRCADYAISLSLPEGYVLVASGHEASNPRGDGTVDWTVTAQDMRDVTLIVSNELTCLSAQSRGVRINSYFFDAGTGREQGEMSLEAAQVALEAFSDAYGQYPYDELDVVASDYEFGGMEAPGLVRISMLYAMMMDSTYEEDRVEYAQKLRGTVAHEVAHEWFYAAVGNNQYREAWLDESFAAYSEQVYWRACGRDEADIAALMDEYLASYEGDPAVDRTYAEFESGRYAGGYTHSVYERGAAFLYALEQALGKEAFGEALRGYYAKHALGEASTADFISALEPYIAQSAEAGALLGRYLSRAQ